MSLSILAKWTFLGHAVTTRMENIYSKMVDCEDKRNPAFWDTCVGWLYNQNSYSWVSHPLQTWLFIIRHLPAVLPCPGYSLQVIM